jgi:hypothetical protein
LAVGCWLLRRSQVSIGNRSKSRSRSSARRRRGSGGGAAAASGVAAAMGVRSVVAWWRTHVATTAQRWALVQEPLADGTVHHRVLSGRCKPALRVR